MSIAFVSSSTGSSPVWRKILVPSLRHVVRRLLARRAARIAERQLQALPDATLRDIGIHRSQIKLAARVPSGASRGIAMRGASYL